MNLSVYRYVYKNYFNSLLFIMEPINLIPITKIKISKEDWLNKPIKYEEDLLVRDIIEIMSNKSYQWIKSKPDLIEVIDYDTFKDQFINCMYDKYLK